MLFVYRNTSSDPGELTEYKMRFMPGPVGYVLLLLRAPMLLEILSLLLGGVELQWGSLTF